MTQDEAPNSLRMVRRTVQVLTVLGQHRKPASITNVASLCGLSRSTTHRILRTLTGAGAVSRSQKGYSLGPLVLELGQRVLLDRVIAAAAKNPLNALTQQYGEASHASIISQFEIELIVYSPSYRSKSLDRHVGKKMPPYLGSSGKLLLAATPAEELQYYLASAQLLRVTANTITDRSMLLKELHAIRDQGYAINRAEHYEGQTSVSVPILGFDGDWLAAIAMSAPSERMPYDALAEIVASLRETSKTITKSIFSHATSVCQYGLMAGAKPARLTGA